MSILKKLFRTVIRLSLIGLLGFSVAKCAFWGLSTMLNAPQYQSIEHLPALNLADIRKNSPNKKDAMLALFRKDDKGKLQFYCTAFVISDRLAITAGHCLVDGGLRLSKKNFIVKDVHFRDTGIEATPAAVNTRADLGAITADFSKFNKMAMNLDPGGFFGTSGPYLTCGFAWGALPAICTEFSPATNYYFEIKGSGYLYPGMSGGPVIDAASRQVVAINTEVLDGQVAVAPTVGILGALELRVKNP